VRAVASPSEYGTDPGSRSWSLHGKDVPKVLGKQIATEAMKLSHEPKVSDNVKAAWCRECCRVTGSCPRLSFLTVGCRICSGRYKYKTR
jgi:hypothetical protein